MFRRAMRDEHYLVNDDPFRAILSFSLPMMLGNLFQQFYTMADSVIVGRFVGEEALAAVGASYALTSVFIAVAIGGGAGSSVITSRAFGARDYRTMKESISTSLISFLVISLVLAVCGFLSSSWILEALNTPGNIMGEADVYLRIYFLGLPFLFMYNILSSVFNALGKSRIPLFLLIFSSLLNVVLDIVAVTALGMGVAGAAWATLISQALSAVISFSILMHMLSSMEGRRSVLFSLPEAREMAQIAIPSILQQSTISFGMMLVQSVVNLFGSEVLAGYSACIRVDSVVTVPMSAIGNAMSPYAAQNIGAERRGRVGGAEGTEAAYATAEHYMSFLGWFYPILGSAMATGGALRGTGDMKLFTIASLANLSFRVAASMLLAPHFGVSVVWYCVPVGWLIYFGLCFISCRRAGWLRKA